VFLSVVRGIIPVLFDKSTIKNMDPLIRILYQCLLWEAFLRHNSYMAFLLLNEKQHFEITPYKNQKSDQQSKPLGSERDFTSSMFKLFSSN
jgi:hypothetical protein